MGIYPNCGFMGIWVWVNTHIFGYVPMGKYPVQPSYWVLKSLDRMNEVERLALRTTIYRLELIVGGPVVWAVINNRRHTVLVSLAIGV